MFVTLIVVTVEAECTQLHSAIEDFSCKITALKRDCWLPSATPSNETVVERTLVLRGPAYSQEHSKCREKQVQCLWQTFNDLPTIMIIIVTRFYIALFTPGGCPKALHIITPGQWALIHSLNHLSSLMGSIQPCATLIMRYSAKSITRTISALTGTHLPLGGEKQL